MIPPMSASRAPEAEHPFRLIASDQAPLLARPFYAGGDPGPIVAVPAHEPELLELAVPLVPAVLAPSAIDGRRKEIIILCTSEGPGAASGARLHRAWGPPAASCSNSAESFPAPR